MMKELNDRAKFLHFLGGLLHPDPQKRFTQKEAAQHPFFTKPPLERTYVPAPARDGIY